MLTQAARAFVLSRRVAHLATADGAGVPHVVPVCFALAAVGADGRGADDRGADDRRTGDWGAGDCAYVTVDEKPKSGRQLRRLANLAANPAFCLVADRYGEDWTRLGWVMLHGRGEILADGGEHDDAQALLRARYPQYRGMELGPLPVIALRIARVTVWGDLSPGP